MEETCKPGQQYGNMKEITAPIAQLGERQTEDLEVPSSILGLGIFGAVGQAARCNVSCHRTQEALAAGLAAEPFGANLRHRRERTRGRPTRTGRHRHRRVRPMRLSA